MASQGVVGHHQVHSIAEVFARGNTETITGGAFINRIGFVDIAQVLGGTTKQTDR
jgi:succinylarginine dihydrolase